MGWFNDTMSWVGKAIPNEISKLNSITKYIPYVGPASQIVSGIDNFATTYDDVRDRGGSQGDAWGAAIQRGYGGAMGSQDPGIYGSPGDNINRDWANMIGQFGNLVGYDKKEGKITANTNAIQGVFSNPYFFKQEGQSIPVSQWQQPNRGGFLGDLVGGFNPDWRIGKGTELQDIARIISQGQGGGFSLGGAGGSDQVHGSGTRSANGMFDMMKIGGVLGNLFSGGGGGGAMQQGANVIRPDARLANTIQPMFIKKPEDLGIIDSQPYQTYQTMDSELPLELQREPVYPDTMSRIPSQQTLNPNLFNSISQGSFLF